MLNIFAPVNSLGYGIHACNVIKSLIEDGEEVSLTPLGEIQVDPFFEIYIKEALKNKENFDVKNPSVFLFHDNFSNQSCGSPLFTFSIFEGTKLKPASKKMLTNGPTDVVLTTTKQHLVYLSKNEISKPIEVINEGVDSTLFNTIPVDKYIETKKFTYITVGKREERKNTDFIIKTFVDQMKDKEVALICHTFNPFLNRTQDHPFKNLICWCGVNLVKDGFDYKGFNGKAHLFSYKNCDIYFTTPTLSMSNLPSLYHSANIGIQVSRGEGWDLPLTEMMACGLPVIATNCLGHSEYLQTPTLPKIQQDLIIQINKFETAVDNIWFFSDQGEWGVLDSQELINKLNQTYDATDYELKNNPLADYMETNYSWNISTRKLIEVINKYRG